MNPLQTLQTLLDQAQSEFQFSGYQLVLSSSQKTHSLLGGVLSYWRPDSFVQSSSYFDLASLTKPLLTVSVLARLVDQNKINILEPVETYDPFWEKSPYGKLLLCDLLSHCAGLLAWYPFFSQKQNWKEILVQNPDQFLIAQPRLKTQYSDIGFLLLGSVLEAFTQKDLKSLFDEQVKRPLGLKQVQFGPIAPDQAVATEWRPEFKACLEGKSFDENAAYWGGVAPHAGLFGSAEGLLPFCKEWLLAVHGKSRWLCQKTAALFSRRSHFVAGSSWALGWDTRSFEGSSAGSIFSERSFGHLGFTGTSVWIDPESSMIAIFLCNRVHPSRLDERIRRFRPLLHDEIVKSLKEESYEH